MKGFNPQHSLAPLPSPSPITSCSPETSLGDTARQSRWHSLAAQRKKKIQHCRLIELNIIVANAINKALIALSILIFNSIKRLTIFLKCSLRSFMLQNYILLDHEFQLDPNYSCSGFLLHQLLKADTSSRAGRTISLARLPAAPSTNPAETLGPPQGIGKHTAVHGNVKTSVQRPSYCH